MEQTGLGSVRIGVSKQSHCDGVPCHRVPQGTSQHLRSLLLGLLKKDPRERISHGVLCDNTNWLSTPLMLPLIAVNRWL